MAISNNLIYNFIDGADGSGQSPYDIWRALGNEGTPAEFLEYLRSGSGTAEIPAELEKFMSVITSVDELNNVKGVTSPIQDQLNNKAGSNHDHNYAAAETVGGSALSAVKLDSTAVGSATKPVYFAEGKPVECTHTLEKSVPSDAKFTDTVYDDTTISNRVKTIEDDYLKAADKTELTTAIGTAKQEAIDTILGKTIDEDFDTLQEVAAWIKSDTTKSSELIARVTTAEGGISTLSGDVTTHKNDTKSHTSDTEKATWNTVTNKVDKVDGKGLSTNDYSDTEKAQVATNKSDISTLKTSVNNKVDKVDGKGLSTNDYSATEKAQVATNKSDIASLKTSVQTLNTSVSSIPKFTLSGTVLTITTN